MYQRKHFWAYALRCEQMPCLSRVATLCCQTLQYLHALEKKKSSFAAEEFESRHVDDSDAHSVATGTTEEDLRPVKVPLLPHPPVTKLAHTISQHQGCEWYCGLTSSYL